MSFFVTGGTLGPDARSYVQRKADRQLLEGLLKGEFCYVLTSRQMGKSSLMLRAAGRLEELGIKVATIDLTAIGAQDVTPEQWYYGLLDLLGEALDLRDSLDTFWRQNQKLGPLQRLMTAIRDVLLPALSVEDRAITEPLPSELGTARGSPENPSLAQPHSSRVRLVIFLDEIDIVRSLGFSVDGFFAAIRECYNRRAQDPAYECLAFCLLGVATPTDLIRDARRTPFNVGRRIELNDFSIEEAAPLVPGLMTGKFNGEVSRLLLARILHWTGGHPYLTQRLCQETSDLLRDSPAAELGNGGSTAQVKRLIDQLCGELFFSAHALRRDPNLSFVSEHLLRSELERASLLDLYRKVRSGHRVPDDELDGLANQLKLAGIVRGSAGRLVVRNRIYERAFDREWVRANMPAAELRRQREAFRRGVVLCTAISLFVLTIMAGLTIKALQARNSERLASARAHFSEAKAQRVSGRSGQRLASLAALYSARRYYTNRAQLIEEATAAVTLMDLHKRPDWNPDRAGKVTAVTTDLSVAAQVEPDSSVTIFNLKNEAVLGSLPQLSPKPRRLQFSPQGTYLLVEHEAGSKGRLSVWNWSQAQQLLTALDWKVEPRAVDFTGDEAKLAIAKSGSLIELYSLPSGTLERTLHLEPSSGLPRSPDLVRFSPCGEFLAEASRDNYRVQIWRLADGKQEGAGVNHTGRVHDIAWSDDGRYLGTACADEAVHVKDLRNPNKPAITLRGHSEAVLRIAFSHKGSLLASTSGDGTLRLWSLASESQLVLHEHEPLDEIRFSTEDDHLICSAAGQARVDLLQVYGKEHVALRAEGGRSRTGKMLDFSGDGAHLLAALSGQLLLFDLGFLRETARVPFTSAHGAYFNSTDEILVSTDAGLYRYPIRSTPDLNQVATEPRELGAIALSPDRQRAAVMHRNQILVFDMSSMFLLSSNVVGQHYHHLAFHPKGQWLAGMSKGSETIELWNLGVKRAGAGRKITPASEHFAFDPSGRWLIISEPGGFRMLEVGSWQEKKSAELSRKEGAMPAGPMALNTSGNILAVASSFHRVELWRMPQENDRAEPELMTALGAFGHVESLAFSADHTWLAAITKDTRGAMIEIWNLKQIWAGLRPYLEERFELIR
jgi:WD40 repeat protein